MRIFFLSLILLLFSSFLILPSQLANQSRPIPPGLHEGEKQINKPLDPPRFATNAPEPSKLKQQADELAQLSAEVPSELGRVAQGQLPKDLSEKLKRIEKLARQLRSELSQ